MSKVFKVAFSYTVYGVAQHVEAETQEEAEQWLFDELSLNGIGEFEYGNAQFEAKVIYRDYHTQDAEEIK